MFSLTGSSERATARADTQARAPETNLRACSEQRDRAEAPEAAVRMSLHLNPQASLTETLAALRLSRRIPR